MFVDSRVLLDQALDDLESLSAYLRDETDERIQGRNDLPEARRCKEALPTIAVLVTTIKEIQRLPFAQSVEPRQQ